jgi:hypothetical protein
MAGAAPLGSILPAGTAGELRNPPVKSHAYGIATGSNRCIADRQAENIGTLERMTGVEQGPG